MIDTTNEMAKYCNMFLPGNNEGKILMGSDDPEKIAVYYHQLGCDELVIKALVPKVLITAVKMKL